MKIHWRYYGLVIALFFIYAPAAIALLVIGMMCREFQRVSTRAMLGIPEQRRTPPSWVKKNTPVHLFLTGAVIIVTVGVYIICC
jgi:hypothetical protein